MRCEDCGGLIEYTPAEIEAQMHGLKICEACLESYEAGADAYDQMMREAGVACGFDPESGRFVQRRIGEPAGQAARGGEGE